MNNAEKEVAKVIILLLVLIGLTAWASGYTLPSPEQAGARAAKETGASGWSKVAKWFK